MQDVLEVTRGGQTLRLCSNGLRWWMEADEADGSTYRHEYRRGSREAIAPLWDQHLLMLAAGVLVTEDSALGTWWLLAYQPETHTED